jgi:hypothetical protein
MCVPRVHKGYKCLHVPTNRVHISRDVTFDEYLFPFASISHHALLPTLRSIPSSTVHDHRVDQANLPVLHDASNLGLPSTPEF